MNSDPSIRVTVVVEQGDAKNRRKSRRKKPLAEAIGGLVIFVALMINGRVERVKSCLDPRAPLDVNRVALCLVSGDAAHARE